jgi:hypothetical protein
LDAFTCNVIILLQFLFDITRHGNDDRSIFIIPIEANTAIKFACPILGKSICLFD